MSHAFPGQLIPAPDATLAWDLHYLSESEATHYFEVLRDSLAWEQGEIRIFGKNMLEPRLSCWYGDPGAVYTYSGKRQDPMPWTQELQALRERLQHDCGCRFNSVLANRYRFGQDSMGWHSDDEPELGEDPIIASLNLGATRSFHLKHKQLKTEKRKFGLGHGSLLVMAGTTQQHWQHQVPKTKREVAERINLTFRYIHPQP